MNKNVLKYIIDAALFVDICTIAVLGLLLGFVIPHGPGIAKNFLGIRRHQWADLHLFLAIILIALLALHLMMNWTWVRESTKRYFGNYWKQFLLYLSGAWVGILIICWIVLKV